VSSVWVCRDHQSPIDGERLFGGGQRCRRGGIHESDGRGGFEGAYFQSANGREPTPGRLLALPSSIEAPRILSRFPLLSAADILAYESPPDLVAGLVPSGGIVVISGDFGTFKSFAILDLLACVAGGWEWAGRKVRPGRVVYSFGEGQAGLRKRVKAWQIARGRLFPSSPDFTFVPAVPHALDQADSAEFTAALVSLNDGVVAVAIDTLSLMLTGGQENSSDVMTRAVQLADDVRRRLHGASVFLIHHVGKLGDSARGHSSLLGNADAELKFSRDEGSDVVTISCGKVKDQDKFDPIKLRRRIVELGTIDAHGIPETSLILDLETSATASKLTDASVRVGALLLETFGSSGATASQWEAVATEAKVSRASYFRAKTALIAAGHVLQEGDGGRGTRYRHVDAIESQGLTKVSNGLMTPTEVSVSRSHHLLSGETLRPSGSDDEPGDELPWTAASADDGDPVPGGAR
jgi:hypothetical protein